MIPIGELTIEQVHDAYQNRSYTCVDLVSSYLDRIQSLDGKGPCLNAINTISHLALEEASALDSHFNTHGIFIGPLHGIPVIVKDQCDTQGVQTTYGNICCKHVPTQDATLVRKLKEAGAVILAKSTMPDFGASYNSASSVSGITLNPYSTSRETGGSSAGTGAAIAANYGLLGVGEDTGGSIRVPASFCNLVGLRPTFGLISRHGLSPLVKTQDTPGPMARTVRDAALMLDVLVGYDPQDPYTAPASAIPGPKGGSYAANLSTETLSRARIGVLNSEFGPDSDPEYASVNKVIRDALSRCSSLTADPSTATSDATTTTTLIDISIPNLDHYVAFTQTYLSRSHQDITTFLSNHPDPTVRTVTLDKIYSTKQFHPSLPLLSRLCAPASDSTADAKANASSTTNTDTDKLSSSRTTPRTNQTYTNPYSDPQYAARLEAQIDFQNLVTGIMLTHNLDAIAYPSVRIAAPRVEDVLGSRFTKSFPTNTDIGSQLKFPAISVPVGFTAKVEGSGNVDGEGEVGLPVGLELLGVPYSEQKLLELAFGFEVLLGARRAPVL